MPAIATTPRNPVLVTGATGFIGSALCIRLAELGYTVRRATRNPPAAAARDDFDTVATGALGPDTDWAEALSGISTVFHLAARTHVLRESARDAYAEYRRINVDGTRTLTQAAKHGEMRRLTGSLQIDSAKIRADLNWSPRFSLAQGFAQTAQWYHSQFPVKSNT